MYRFLKLYVSVFKGVFFPIFLFFRKLHGLTQTQQKKKKKKSDTTDVKIVFHLCVFMSNFIS